MRVRCGCRESEQGVRGSVDNGSYNKGSPARTTTERCGPSTEKQRLGVLRSKGKGQQQIKKGEGDDTT